jgi:hypothetical protein
MMVMRMTGTMRLRSEKTKLKNNPAVGRCRPSRTCILSGREGMGLGPPRPTLLVPHNKNILTP